MESEFPIMQQALVRLVEGFIKRETFEGWQVDCRVTRPDSLIVPPDDIPGLKPYSGDYEVVLSIRCQRPCCCAGPDEMAHELTVDFTLYEKSDEALFKLHLNGLPYHDEDAFPRIEGWTDYDIDSFPEIRFSAPTVASVLDAGRRLLEIVPEWHRFLAADTTDWETRMDMMME